MSNVKFTLIVMLLVCNAAALLAFAWFAFRKSPSNAKVAALQLAQENVPSGIRLCEVEKDGLTQAAEMAGSACRVAHRAGNAPAYIYFAIEPSFKRPALADAIVAVEYFDYAPGEFRLTYDGVSSEGNRPSPYRLSEEKEKCLGSQRWRKAIFLVRDARFQNSQNGGADFRIELRVPELHVRRVTVSFLD